MSKDDVMTVSHDESSSMIHNADVANHILFAPLATQKHCPTCGGGELRDIFRLQRIPINVGVLLDNYEEARRAPIGDIVLSQCQGCEFVFNRLFDLEKTTFEPGYEVALHHSDIFRSFMDSVADRLIDRFDLHGKQVVEIGCGGGYFLRLLCERGDNFGIGIDPTVAREGVEQAGGGSVRFIRDFYSARYADLPANFVCCLSVFEDIPRPEEFLKMLRRVIGDRQIGVYFEVFNGMGAIERRENWSIHYEQCNYFGLDSFKNLFQRCGFDVTDSGYCYEGDQYIFVEAKPSEENNVASTTPPPTESAAKGVAADFAECHRERVNDWTRRLDKLFDDRRRVVLWGSGGKGISFLNVLDPQSRIPYVVDINPDRQGGYVPGSGQKVVAPEFLRQYRPDVVIITNPLYEREIRNQVDELGLSCEFIHA